MKQKNIYNDKEELKILHQISQKISSSLELSEVLDHISEVASAFIGADACLIYLYDRKNQELILRASKNPHKNVLGRIKLKLGEGITGFVAKQKKPLAIEKEAYKELNFRAFTSLPEDTYEAFLSIPILSRGQLVGVINLHHKKAHKYPERQVKLLFTLAGYLGTAIENAITYEEMEKKAKQLDLLSKISKSLVSESYLKEILKLIVSLTAHVMDSKICTIMLLDEKNNELKIASSEGSAEAYIKKPNVRIDRSISGRVVKEKKPVAVLEVAAEPTYMFPDIAKKEGAVSLLSVPMMLNEKVIGVINIYTKKEHLFTTEEIEVFQAIANQAASAIEKANLKEEVTAAKEALATRKLVEKAKGLLMKELKIGEEEAHKLIHKKSMDLRKSMKEVAEAVILSFEMKNSSSR